MRKIGIIGLCVALAGALAYGGFRANGLMLSDVPNTLHSRIKTLEQRVEMVEAECARSE